MKTIPVKLTDEQVKAVEAAFPDSPDLPFSEKLRELVARGLALHRVQWPETPQHGGKRSGAGRKKETETLKPKYETIASKWSDTIHASVNGSDPICGTDRNGRIRFAKREGRVTCLSCLKRIERDAKASE